MTAQFILTEELNPFESLLKVVVSVVNRLYQLIDRLTGLLGIVILMPVFAILAFVVWLVLKASNRKLDSLVKDLFKEISKVTPRDTMLFHHAIKNRRIVADEMILKLQPTSTFFLLAPLYGQVKRSRAILFGAEERLHKTVYPHIYQPLTSEQKAELQRLSVNMQGIWEDSDCLTIR